MKYITLGIIGHVDHGKTTLVKALTGIDTDRLKEEKERGISIALGYSHLTLPEGEIGIIDALGHEKFIRTMISGATGSEAVLLVVDINEGVKPQTIEHLEIAELLGIKRGVIAITKSDTADADMHELILEEIRELAEGTFLEDAPAVLTSATTGQGLDALKAELATIVSASTPLTDEGFFYLPVDRVFSIAGHGTVVTGTLRRGAVRIGDEVEICPQGKRAIVRELQSHNQRTEEARPGFRTAVNLRGVEKSQLNRGDALATPGTLEPSAFLDVRLRALESAPAPLKHGQVVRLLFGTKETFARLHLLDRNELLPGEEAVLQFRVEEEVAALNLEPFIIRTYSPMRTVGGGKIIGASKGRYKRRDAAVLKRMEVIAEGDTSSVVLEKLVEAGTQCVELEFLAMDRRIGMDELKRCLAELPAVMLGDDHAIHRTTYDETNTDLVNVLSAFHKSDPTLRGLTKPQLNTKLRDEIGSMLLNHLIDHGVADGRLVIENGLVRVADFEPGQSLSQKEKDIAREIEDAFRSGKLKPPSMDEVLQGDKARTKIYRYLVDSAVLMPVQTPTRNRAVKNTIAFHRDVIEESKKILTDTFANTHKFSTPEAKDALDTSRKYLIPLLEYFDATGFTRRAEDIRIIRSR